MYEKQKILFISKDYCFRINWFFEEIIYKRTAKERGLIFLYAIFAVNEALLVMAKRTTQKSLKKKNYQVVRKIICANLLKTTTTVNSNVMLKSPGKFKSHIIKMVVKNSISLPFFSQSAFLGLLFYWKEKM